MRRSVYIHQHKNWPQLTWDKEALAYRAGQVRYVQGKLLGKMEGLGFKLREEAVLETLTQDVLRSSEIEGEFLNMQMVRSSVARHLGMNVPGLSRSDQYTDGVVEMMLDATQHYAKPLSKERLFSWHAALFPTGQSGMHKITVGNWRDDAMGPMQVVSGPMGKEKVHFEAPPARLVNKEMRLFLKWFNTKDNTDPLLRSGLAHFWFVTVHPFDDGNGRMARALADLLLARADETNQRFYSMSAQILAKRKDYYAVLERTQKGNLDVSEWLAWYLDCLEGALKATGKTLEKVLAKANFWEKHAATVLNERQRKMLNKLQDGLEGKLSSSKWAKMCKCSHDTALRDLQDLLDKKMLRKDAAGGRSTSYELLSIN